MSALTAESIGTALTRVAARQVARLREKLLRKNAALLEAQQETMLFMEKLKVLLPSSQTPLPSAAEALLRQASEAREAALTTSY